MFVGGGFVVLHVFEFTVGLLFMIWRWVLGFTCFVNVCALVVLIVL